MKQKKLLVSMFFLLFCGTLVCATKSQAKILTIKHSTKNVYTTKYQREATSYLTKWKKGEKNFGCPSVSKKSIWHTEYLYLLLCGFYRTTLRQVHHYSQRCGNGFWHFSRRIGSKCAPNSRISDSGTRCRQKKYSRN